MAARRVLAVASGGGHWVQLLRLRPAFEGCEVSYVTTMRGAESMAPGSRVWIAEDASRSNPLKLALLLLHLAFILLRTRPHVVVTTGAAPGLLALRLGKLAGAKAVWIDSIANAEELSLSGRLARRHADLCLTQWAHLADAAGGVRYGGAVI